MVSYIGNNIRPNGIGLIPPRKIIEGGYRTIIGNGSGLFSKYLSKSLLIHACDLERYILYNGVFSGPFAANEPAWRNVSIPGYGSVPLLQVERTSDVVNTYSEVFRAAISDWINSACDITDNTYDSPWGLTVADTLFEDTATALHITRQLVPFDGSSQYIFAVCVKAKERYKCRLSFGGGAFPGVPACFFNLSTGVAYSSVSCDDYGIIALNNAWYLCYIIVTSDVATSSYSNIQLIDDDDTQLYLGDGSSGLYICGANVGIGSWVSSYIQTVASSETKPPTESRIAAADVPAWMHNRFIIPWVPYGSSTQFSAANRTLCEMRDSSEDWILYFKGSTGEVILNGSGSGDILTKSAITFDREAKMLFDFTLNNGSVASLTVSGADTGDGNQVGSAAISFDGNFHIGSQHTTGNEIDGLIWVLQP